MPRSRITFGPFAAIYVGDFGSSNPLIRVSSQRCKGTRFLYECPQQYEPLLGGPIQSGEAKLQFDLSFYGIDQIIMNMAMGNVIETPAAEDAPSSFAKYTILLLARDKTATDSFLIPVCWTQKRVGLNYEKTAPREIAINFEVENRNRFVQLYYKGSLSTLKSVPTYGARITIS